MIICRLDDGYDYNYYDETDDSHPQIYTAGHLGTYIDLRFLPISIYMRAFYCLRSWNILSTFVIIYFLYYLIL